MTFLSASVTALRLLPPLLWIVAAAGRSPDSGLRTGPGPGLTPPPPPPAIVSEPRGTGPSARDPVTTGGRKRSTDTQPSVFEAEKNPLTVSNEAWSAESREGSCNCSTGAEGILDPEQCNQTSGQCACLSGYTGLQCEDCEDGLFTNGSSGCLPCGCDSFGAVDHFCDSSGTCVCKTGVYGPKCDECHPGFFRFSSSGCQLCQCHNHTANCHPQSGICLNCVSNTQGSNCEECKPGFYRRPAAALTEACAPCPCSNSTSNGTCHFDLQGSLVCDQCLPRYGGPQCDRCSAGFFKVSGACVPCDCSGNADPQGPSQVCDPDSGRCLRCLDSTAGLRCQLCASGFIGDAQSHNCTRLQVAPTMAYVTTAEPTASPPSTTSSSSSPSTALLTSTGSPKDNTTAPLTEVSWTQFNVIVLVVIILVVLLLLGFVGGVYTYREYQNRKLNAPFWTIELKEDNISFSSYHDSIPNADVSGLLEDEATEVAAKGQLALTTQGNCYKA